MGLDRPFAGLVTIKPTLIRQEAHDLATQYRDANTAPLPCDDHGNPVK